MRVICINIVRSRIIGAFILCATAPAKKNLFYVQCAPSLHGKRVNLPTTQIQCAKLHLIHAPFRTHGCTILEKRQNKQISIGATGLQRKHIILLVATTSNIPAKCMLVTSVSLLCQFRCFLCSFSCFFSLSARSIQFVQRTLPDFHRRYLFHNKN